MRYNESNTNTKTIKRDQAKTPLLWDRGRGCCFLVDHPLLLEGAQRKKPSIVDDGCSANNVCWQHEPLMSAPTV